MAKKGGMFLMKNTIRFLSIIAIIAVFGLAVIGCNDGGDNNNGNNGSSGNGALGSTLVITNQQVYEAYSNTSIYTGYTGSDTLDSSENYGGTGAITKGKLNFTLGTPTDTFLTTFDAHELATAKWKDSNPFVGYDVTVSNPQTKGLSIGVFTTGASELRKYNYNDSGNFHSETYVCYIYVDNDVTITGKGTTDTWGNNKDFSLKLKTGWNVVNGTSTYNSNLNTYSVSLGDSSSGKWFLDYYSWTGGGGESVELEE